MDSHVVYSALSYRQDHQEKGSENDDGHHHTKTDRKAM